MFKPQRLRKRLSRERFDFKFSNFQALQVSKGLDRLFVSLISVETGKIIAQLDKALVRNGCCQWRETLSESFYISRDDSPKGYEDALLKLVLTTGSTRYSVLGEAIINVTAYAGSRMAAKIILPLKNSTHGTFFELQIECLTPRPNIRYEESKYSNPESVNHMDMDSRSNGSECSTTDNNVAVLSEEQASNSLLVSSVHSNVEEETWSSSASVQSFDSPEVSIGRECLSTRNNTLKAEADGSYGGSPTPDYCSVVNVSQWEDCSLDSGMMHLRQDNCQEDLNRPSFIASSGPSRNLLVVVENINEEFRVEAQMWERNARKLMLDLDISQKEVSDLTKKQAELEMELLVAHAEQENMKNKMEQVKLELQKLQENPSTREELEKDCAEVTNENLELLFQLKDFNTAEIRENPPSDSSGSDESEVSDPKFHVEEEEVQILFSESSKQIAEIFQLLDMSFQLLRKPPYDERERGDTNTDEGKSTCRIMSAENVVSVVQEMNKVLEMRIAESDRIQRQHYIEISDKDRTIADAMRKNQELQEKYTVLATQLRKSRGALSDCAIKVKCLDGHLASFFEDFSARENGFKSDIDALILKNSQQNEKLVLLETLHHTFLEKAEVFEKEVVEHLNAQIIDVHKEKHRISLEAYNEVSLLLAEKAGLQASLHESELEVGELRNQIAASVQRHDRLRADQERTLKLLASYKKSEEKLKKDVNELKRELEECQLDKGRLKQELHTVTEAYKTLKALYYENVSTIGDGMPGKMDEVASQEKLALQMETELAGGDVVTRETYERTKSSLEIELRDLRARYLEMSLKYAEVEAQRENLVMKLKKNIVEIARK